MSTDPELREDCSHPISNVEVCDVHGERENGGHDLILLIASPLEADVRSQKRLVEKLRQYVVAIEALRAKGAGQCRVVVKAHRDTTTAIFDLLERSRVWIEHDGVSLEISKITS